MIEKLKKIFIQIKWMPSHLINLAILKIRKVSCGKNLRTFGLMFIRGTGCIQIGNNVKINSCRETNPIGGDTKTILHAKGDGRIYIGDNTGISNAAIIALECIKIGKNVFIGGNCKIYDHDFHSLDYEERIREINPTGKSQPVVIKEGAFIGAHCIILKGVTIGEKSIIGAGSVVTRSVPDNEIWAGNPAHFIRKVV